MYKCIAYITPDDDAMAVRATLAARYGACAVRAGARWHGEVETASIIWAPGYPGIQRAYATAGSAIAGDGPIATPAPPNELSALPRHAELTIVSAGPTAPEAVRHFGAIGPIMAVNHGNRAVYGPIAYHVAMDGFGKHPDALQGIRITKRQHAATVPPGDWYAIDPIFVGRYELSSLAAFTCALHMAPQRLRIIGHDCTAERGISPQDHGWDTQRAASLRALTEECIAALTKAGTTVEWCRKIHGPWTVDVSRPDIPRGNKRGKRR